MTGVLGLARRDGNRRYYDLIERLLPDEILGAHGPGEAADASQAAFAVPRPRSLGRRRRRGRLRQPRPGEAGPEVAWVPGSDGTCARSSSPTASSFPSPSRVSATHASCFARRSSYWARRRSRVSAWLSLLAEVDALVRDSPSSGRCSASTTCGSSSCRRPSVAGAGTCCRSYSATDWSGASSPASPTTAAACESSTSGGRSASIRCGPTASSTRCAGAPCLPWLRRRRPRRVAAAPPTRGAALPAADP